MKPICCFKAYDIRGRVPEELNEDVAYRVGRAYTDFLQAKKIVVGHDVRLSSTGLSHALVKGINDGGADVLFIGECGTEEVYFATFDLKADGGICVTASHNPMDYNGMKLVGRDSRPISGDSGLNDIKNIAEKESFKPSMVVGDRYATDIRDDYVRHLLSYVDTNKIKPLKVVVNAGNGGAGAIIDKLEAFLPIDFIKVHHKPDGNFPNGIPNPLLPEKRQATRDAVVQHSADLGIAWDGDFDRCFFFDHTGEFIEGYYIVGLLAEAFLIKNPESKIIHDPRLTWNTLDIVERCEGYAIQSKTGHAFIKESMRKEDAVYGGEMSAHHYFKDFAYCDNGNIPWLLIVELLSIRDKNLSELVSQRMKMFPCSGEINDTVNNPEHILIEIEKIYIEKQKNIVDSKFFIEKVDGLSVCFSEWRFNLRMSSTEPVIRLNVEARKDATLMTNKTQEVLSYIHMLDAKS